MNHPDLSADLEEVPADTGSHPINADGSPMNAEEIEEARTFAQARFEELTRAREAAESSEQDVGPRRIDMPLNNNERRISAMKLANLFDDLCWADDENLKVHRFKEIAHEIADAVTESLYE